MPLVGEVRVRVHFFPAEQAPSVNAAPHVDTPAADPNVSVVSSPVATPSFIVRSEYVIPVKSKSEGNATATVIPEAPKAVGVLNLIKWVDNPLAV